MYNSSVTFSFSWSSYPICPDKYQF